VLTQETHHGHFATVRRSDGHDSHDGHDDRDEDHLKAFVVVVDVVVVVVSLSWPSMNASERPSIDSCLRTCIERSIRVLETLM